MKRACNPIAIRGAGGGGGGKGGGGGGSTRAPIESPDSLRSRQYARVVDLVSEGEIEGLVDGLKSVYLDDTPVEAADGTLNFSGVTLITRPGTQSQAYIPGFPAVEAESAVSTEFSYALPVTRSISNVNADAARLTVSVPQLTYQSLVTGDTGPTPVDIAIDVNTAGGGWVQALTDTISGKTTSRYQRAYRIELPGNGPWDIRLRRLTADSTQSNLRNATWWDSYTEIIDSKLRYPNSALCALAVDAEQFRAIPRRGYDIKGLKVRIPSNYDPATRIYTGVWDGTFSVAWTDNPAWCFYDLLVAERYGLGAFLDATQIDKWALYTIGQYCDELVENGFGSLEPRFTCNLYLQTREEAYRTINGFASIFRGMVYWSGGALTPVQDAPRDVAAMFAPANVVGGQFQYQGSSAKARHTVALVAWNDPADRYRQKIEYVEDPDGIARYGVVQTEILAVGCTSRGQAHRIGRWLLYTERLESETVTFRAGLEGLAVAPGEVIQTTDPIRAGSRMGGRVAAATTASVTLDASVTLASGKTYTLWAALPDGTVESRTVTTGAGSTATLAVSPAFSAAPQAEAIWVLAASDLVPESWRIVSVTEIDRSQAEIVAIAYRADKYAAVEQNLVLEPLQTSSLNTTPDTPTSIDVTESLYLVTSSVVGARVTVSWLGSSPYYELQWRRDGGNWTTLSTQAVSLDIQPAEPGSYDFRLTAINALGRRSVAADFSATIYGLASVPANVAGFAIAAIGGAAHLSWAASADLDVIVGGHLRIRHTTDTIAPDWSSAIDIGPQVPGSATHTVLPLLSGAYLAKWVDSSGNESAAASGIVTNAPSVLALNFVDSVIEHPGFSGVKTNVAKVTGGITLDSAETIDEQLANIDTWPRLGALGGIATSGEYAFAGSVDLGSVQTSRLTASLAVAGYDMLDLIDERPNVNTWPSVDGDLIDDVACTIWIRSTPDNPGGTPTWSAWAPFVVGDYTARAFQFKAVLETFYTTHNLLVSELAVTVDMPDRIEAGEDIVSGAGAYSVTYALPFMVPPAVGISAQGMATGDYYDLAGKDATGFDITFRNAGGSAVSRTFDYIAKGY
jgi:predicted phage tail protein